MAISREKKQRLVESYVERLTNSYAVVLTDYRGMNVQQLEALRGRLREQGGTVQVVKNTLLRIALQQAGMPIPEEQLVGPVALVYLPEDVATVARMLFDFVKEEETPTIKGAILEGQVLDAAGARRLAELPSRATVLAQLVGAIQGPPSELVRTLQAPVNELYRTIQAPLRELALTIQAYADKGAAVSA